MLNTSTLVTLLATRAERQRDEAAFIFLEDGDAHETRITYRQLDARARAVAARLRELGGEGERVVLLYPPGVDYIVAFFGCLYAGAVAVPAYPPDPARLARTLPRLQGICSDAGAAFVMTTEPLLAMAHQLRAAMPWLFALRWLTTSSLSYDASGPARQPTADDVAFLQYTSGSTSSPKGVVLTHGNLLANQRMIAEAFPHDDATVVVGWLPLYHDMGLIGNVLHPIYLGRPCVLMSPLSFLQRPVRWLRAISRYRGTSSGGPDFAYALCTRKIRDEELDGIDLGSWRVAFSGAEPVRSSTLQRFAARFGRCGFAKTSFSPCYGLAEASLIVSGGHAASPQVLTLAPAELQRHSAVEADGGIPIVSCGRPLDGEQLLVVHPETRTRKPDGEIGEIWVRGPHVASGYWRNPAATAETFAATTADGGERFLRTGDLGFLRDGELFVTGRCKDLVIIRGRNHYPQDLERTIEESHRALRPGCGAVFTVELDGAAHLTAVYEVDQRRLEAGTDLVAAARRAVAEQHDLHLHELVLVRPGTIPKTSSGKIQRAQCREHWSAGTLERVVAATAAGASAQPNGTAQALARLAEGVLGLEVGSLALDAPLTAHGLDSLRAVDLQHAAETRLELVVQLGDLLAGHDVARLAAEARPAAAPTTDRGDDALAPNEDALWLAQQLAPDSRAYHVAIGFDIEGALDVEAFARAWLALTERHAALRTVFVVQDGRPRRRVLPTGAPLTVCQLGDRGDDAARSAWLSAEAARPFALDRGPLVRATLGVHADGTQRLIMVAHHLVVDLWSLGVLLDELRALYSGVTPLPPPILERIRFALAGSDDDKRQHYWQTQLAGAPVLAIPADRSRPSRRRFVGDVCRIELDRSFTDALKRLASQHHTTLHALLLTAYCTMLARYSGQNDLVVGTPSSGRSRAELRRAVGYFVEPLPIRARVAADDSFLSLLARVRQTIVDALAHQGAALHALVDARQARRVAGGASLFQAWFAMQESPTLSEDSAALALGIGGVAIPFGSATLRTAEVPLDAAEVDLSLLIAEHAGGLIATLRYARDRFERGSADRLLDSFTTLLHAIVTDATCPVSALPLVSPGDRRRLAAATTPRRAMTPADCLHHRFERHAIDAPSAVAVSCDGQSWTYAKLDRRAMQVAHRLRRLGVGRGATVGVFVERSIDLVVAILGVLKSGAAYVPVDPAYPAERIAFMLADSQVQALVTDGDAGEYPCGAVVRIDDPELLREATTPLDRCNDPSDLAYIIYTSGSTGVPKGVRVHHAQMTRLFDATEATFEFGRNDVVALFHSCAFDFSVWELWSALAYGGRLVVVPHGVSRQPDALCQLLSAEGVTVLNQTPSAFQLLDPADADRRDPLSLRLIIFGGEALDPRALQSWIDRHGDDRPRLVNMYGITETTVHVTVRRMKRADLEGGSVIGVPLDDLGVYLLDARGELVPDGVAGEIHVAGGGVAAGYHRRPSLTAERFLPDPFAATAGARMYRSGDLARRLPNGDLQYLGRVDQQVKIRGFRVELGEIESILRTHPAVRDVAVLARGERGSTRLTAYVVANAAAPLADLRSFARTRLPDYMVPSSLMVLERLPQTSNGKVDRKALARLELDPAPARNQAQPGAATGTRSAVEATLLALWKELLQLDDIGRDDDFFELGGHSVVATQLMARVSEELGVRLPLRTLFESPTIAGLTEAIERERACSPTRARVAGASE